jgi:hypothetical protein
MPSGTTVATHLVFRDRVALVFRIVGAVAGFAIMTTAFATSSWSSAWVIALFTAVVVGGAVSYHLLTSIVRCPGCSNGVVNLRIGPIEERRKQFSCRRCGTMAWLAEGFYWQHDING